ncbi:Multicopper oxidase [Nitrosomonas sp. Nm33]|nr:Multicopper oxidase [Nitrosomonas sp. Nm33]
MKGNMSSHIYGKKMKTITAIILFITTWLFSSITLAASHNIILSAETLPNGQYGYKMISHTTDGAAPNYPADAVIPGPTLFVQGGDVVNIQLTNNTNIKVGFNVGGLSVGNAISILPKQTRNYRFNADKVGTFPYGDEKSALLGLFGAIVVDDPSGKVQSFLDGDGTLTAVKRDQLNKEFVMFMVGSTFWGAEISADGTQKPLWTNPTLGAVENQLVRFHVLAVGHAHTFHLHAHRWPDSTNNGNTASSNIIDVKLMSSPHSSHTFTIKAGTGVGPGVWQYHCHVMSHMQSGMNGKFHVVAAGSGETGDSIAGASPRGKIFLNDSDEPGLVTFIMSDEPGSWFRSARGNALSPVTHTKSLEIIPPGSSVHFIMSDTNGVHTVTNLLWPSDAGKNDHGGDHFMIPIDETKAYRGGGIVQLNVPGLYVFTCKIHPFMFAAVIVDDPKTDGLDLGNTIDLVSGIKDLPTSSDLATRLVSTFFIATTPSNWRDFTSTNPWHVAYPNVDVVTDAGKLSLVEVLEARYGQDVQLTSLSKPATPGVGEVWVDTQFEKTAGKTKPGAITVLDTSDWTLKRKIALPQINMNNPHNMWANRDHSVVYATQWFDTKLTLIDQKTGKLIKNIHVGDTPSHVMTLPTTDDVTIAIHGENGVVRMPVGTTEVDYMMPTQQHGQAPANPHGHWISADGKRIITPNVNTGDAGIYDTETGQIVVRTQTGGGAPVPHPIAIGMMPDSSRVYAANLLHHSISVLDGNNGALLNTINLIADYNPITGEFADKDGNGVVAVGVLPIQTPVSPDGKVMVTASMGGQIVITDTTTNKIVKMLSCDPGCHGANFGAKQGGGYYAYVSSKFSNRLIVVDPDPNGDGKLDDAEIAGSVSMVADKGVPKDDTVSNLAGFGGQGVLPLPIVYNGWVQNLPSEWSAGLTDKQRNPIQ